jgi:hypothetical protein
MAGAAGFDAGMTPLACQLHGNVETIDPCFGGGIADPEYGSDGL